MNFNKLIEISRALNDPKRELRNFHTSFLLFKNKIVAIGVNQDKTHPINLRNKKFDRDGNDISGSKGTCSELNAFLKLRNKTNIQSKKCSLVNIRIDRNNNLNFARPCQSCVSLLKFLEIKDVYFSNWDGNFIKFNA